LIDVIVHNGDQLAQAHVFKERHVLVLQVFVGVATNVMLNVLCSDLKLALVCPLGNAFKTKNKGP
jgi:hypothetical protein